MAVPATGPNKFKQSWDEFTYYPENLLITGAAVRRGPLILSRERLKDATEELLLDDHATDDFQVPIRDLRNPATHPGDREYSSDSEVLWMKRLTDERSVKKEHPHPRAIN